MKNYKETAIAYFNSGYNCSQSVLLTFHEELGLDFRQAARMISGFGGGMGRLREVCGAISAGVTVLSGVYGYEQPDDDSTKAALYDKIQTFAKAFEDRNQSIICRELLELTQHTDPPIPSARTAEYYESRPCARLVGDAAELVAGMLSAAETKPL